MSFKKEKSYKITEVDYIRYLLQEGYRQGQQKNPHLYPEILKFIKTPLGIESFNKFSSINPRRLGINSVNASDPLKRAYKI